MGLFQKFKDTISQSEIGKAVVSDLEKLSQSDTIQTLKQKGTDLTNDLTQNETFQTLKQKGTEFVGKVEEKTTSLTQKLEEEIDKINKEQEQNEQEKKTKLDSEAISNTDTPQIHLEKSNEDIFSKSQNAQYFEVPKLQEQRQTSSTILLDKIDVNENLNLLLNNALKDISANKEQYQLNDIDVAKPIEINEVKNEVQQNKKPTIVDSQIDSDFLQIKQELEQLQSKADNSNVESEVLTLILNNVKKLNKNHLIDFLLRLIGVQNKKVTTGSLAEMTRRHLETLSYTSILAMALYLVRILFRAYGFKAMLVSSVVGYLFFNKVNNSLNDKEETQASIERQRGRAYIEAVKEMLEQAKIDEQNQNNIDQKDKIQKL